MKKIERLIILIGGTPCSGKTELAKSLSKKLGIPWISTDVIRSFMKTLVRREDYPDLFDLEGITAEEYLITHTAQEVVEEQNRESEDVWKGVSKFISVVTEWSGWESYLIEGVAVLPHHVFELTKTKRNTKVLFLIDKNEERLRKVIYTRGLWDDANKYPDSVKEKEVAWCLKFNEWLEQEVRRYNLPLLVLEATQRDTMIKQALQILQLKT